MLSQEEKLARTLTQPSVLYNIALIHPKTGDEKRIPVWSVSNEYGDVQFAASLKQAELGLQEYRVFKSDRVDLEFSALIDRMGAGAALIQLRIELAKRFDAIAEEDSLDALEAFERLDELDYNAAAIDGVYPPDRMEVAA